jgi:hypothetical protein
VEPGAPPPFRPMYRLSPVEQAEVKLKLTDLLDKGLVEPSTSPYGASILFVGKKDGFSAYGSGLSLPEQGYD